MFTLDVLRRVDQIFFEIPINLDLVPVCPAKDIPLSILSSTLIFNMKATQGIKNKYQVGAYIS